MTLPVPPFRHKSPPVVSRACSVQSDHSDVREERGLTVLVEAVDDGDTGLELRVDNLVRREVLELLDNAPERVAVRGDEDLLALLDERGNLGVVVRQGALRGQLERLAAGRGDVVRATPDVDLVLAELLAGCDAGGEADDESTLCASVRHDLLEGTHRHPC